MANSEGIDPSPDPQSPVRPWSSLLIRDYRLLWIASVLSSLAGQIRNIATLGQDRAGHLFAHYWDPHTPYRAPDEFYAPFRDQPLPAWYGEEIRRRTGFVGDDKDLLVDMEPFFASYREVLPYLVNDDPAPDTERRQSQKDRERFDDTTKCILCAACTTSCPVFWADEEYFGPAAIVNAHRFIFDSRDQGAAQRLTVLNDKEGVWRCRTTFNCTDACPRGIKVTQAIQEVKRALLFRKV